MKCTTKKDVEEALNDFDADDATMFDLILNALECRGLLLLITPFDVMKHMTGRRIYAHVDDLFDEIDAAIVKTGKWI